MNVFVLFFQQLFKLVLPILSLYAIGYAFFLGVPIFGFQFCFWGALLVAFSSMFIGFYLYHTDRDMYVAYGFAIASASLCYATIYQAFITFRALTVQEGFWYLTIIACAAGYVVLRFRGWLLAVLAVAMGLVTPSLVLGLLPRIFLAWYFVGYLSIVMLVAYVRGWFELVLLSFFGYLLFNPILFAFTALEPKKGFLSIYQVLWVTGAIGVVYTLVPYVYSFFRAQKRIFESISITLGGAYSFALIRFVIQKELAKVEQLPFFLKFLAGEAPTMEDVHVNMFLIFGAIYAVLFVLLYAINRKAKVVLSTLASLSIICVIGAYYSQKRPSGMFLYILRFRRFVLGLLRVFAR